MFGCARRSMPKSSSVASRAGSIPAAGNAASHSTPRQARPTSQRVTSSSPRPMRAAKEPIARPLPEILGVGEEAPALLGEVVER